MLDIKIVRTTEPKAKPQDESKLGFGKIFTDHMFLMNYDEGKGWHDPRIVPYGPPVKAGMTPALCRMPPCRWTPLPWCSITHRKFLRA